MQFLYTVVQDHPVWSSGVFWESAFFDDIQNAIQNLYVRQLESNKTKASAYRRANRFILNVQL